MVVVGFVLWAAVASAQLISFPKVIEERPAVENFYPIHEMNQKNFGLGTYEAEGFVISIYTCPPCAAHGLCKPCMNKNIVISEENKVFKGYEHVLDQDLIVFVDDTWPFDTGVKYKFLIQILDVKTTNQKLNNAKLIYFEKANQLDKPKRQEDIGERKSRIVN